jgi:outer membrane protein assembly factor BamB
MRLGAWVVGWVLVLACVGAAMAEDSGLLLYGTEGNRLRRYDVDTIGADRLAQEVLIERASANESGGGDGPGRDVNGEICQFPDGSGRLLAGEDTGQPDLSAGWGIFEADGRQSGKLVATYQVAGAEPHGCAFDPNSGLLFTSSVGEQGFTNPSGQLIVWFPPYEGFPQSGNDPNPISRNFCKLATNIGTAGSVEVDEQGRIWVGSSSGLSVVRFNPPFPTSATAAGGCGDLDSQGSPLVDASLTEREAGEAPFRENVVVAGQEARMFTFSGVVRSGRGTMFVSSVLTGRVAEYDLDGNFLRFIVDFAGPGFGPDFELPTPFGSPQGLAVGPDGTLYYADLDLQGDLPDFGTVGPGDDGKVWRVRFDESDEPLAPEIVRDALAFPDGVAVFAGNLQRKEWLTFAGGASRKFDNPDETILTQANVGQLALRWAVPTDAVVTGSPTVASVDVPFEGLTSLAFFQSWDFGVRAVRVRDGSVLWRFDTEDQPGASFPGTASIHIERIDHRDVAFVAQGHRMYALDAASGDELWHFTAGSGCRDEAGEPPGLCGFDGERNEIESSPFVADGKVFFGMDVNDVATGKGGFYAIDARDGRLVWFFDLESGSSCHPFPADDIRRYDGYHSELELGLPDDFFATRPGCDHPRTQNGCGNVWSSPAVDLGREALFFGSSNCDTEVDEGSGLPAPMPPFDEAIVSLGFDGEVRWAWRPRDFDNDDLAFGGVPNLFSIPVDPGFGPLLFIDVVGLGNKDGSYYVLDRDGRNRATGEAWDDHPDTHLPAGLPYWETNLVPGGEIGGILATAAVDELGGRIHISTAPGTSDDSPPGPPQTPTVHALDIDTGEILWDNTGEIPSLASFSSMSLIPGVVFAGSSFEAIVRAYTVSSPLVLGRVDMGNFGIGSTPVVVDGTMLVGAGIGTRTSTGSGLSDVASNIPSPLSAFCVAGTLGCAACNDGVDNDLDGFFDAAEDDGCVNEADDSEVLGDLDYDGLLDERDREIFFETFGRSVGEVGYRVSADLEPVTGPDGTIDLVDMQRWLDAEEMAVPEPSQPMLGAAALLVLAILVRTRGRRYSRAGARGAGSQAGFGVLVTLAIAASAAPADATVELRFESADPSFPIEEGVLAVPVGQEFTVAVVADIVPDLVHGWGLDLVHDDTRIALVDTVVADEWVGVFASDGDGLAGLAPTPAAVAGLDRALATLVLRATRQGNFDLGLGVTAGDASEGFALRTVGAFASVDFGSGLQIVVPEPGSGALLVAGLAAAMFGSTRSGRRGRRRSTELRPN